MDRTVSTQETVVERVHHVCQSLETLVIEASFTHTSCVCHKVVCFLLFFLSYKEWLKFPGLLFSAEGKISALERVNAQKDFDPYTSPFFNSVLRQKEMKETDWR